MSLRCAVCGSKNVAEEFKNEGFNHKKAALGVALVGSIGTLVGINGNKMKCYHCGECGQTLNYAMSDSEARSIDFAIDHKNIPSFLEELRNYKNKYKNIEFSSVDEMNLIRIINSKEVICGENVIRELENYLKRNGKKSYSEVEEYFKSLGYTSEIIDNIPEEIANNIDENYNNILFTIDNNIFCYEYTTRKTIEGDSLEKYNSKLYKSFFANKIKQKEEKFQEEKKQRDLIEQAVLNLFNENKIEFTINDLIKSDVNMQNFEKNLIELVLLQLENRKFSKSKKINDEYTYYWSDKEFIKSYINRKNKIREISKNKKEQSEIENHNYLDKLENIIGDNDLSLLDINSIKLLYESSRFKTLDKCFVVDFIFVISLIFLANNENIDIWKKIANDCYGYYKGIINSDKILEVLKKYPSQIKSLTEDKLRNITFDYIEDYKKISDFISWKIKW